MTPQYHFAINYFGGKQPELDFREASNIIFTNGDLDPWSRGGINTTFSSKIDYIFIRGAAHHLDLFSEDSSDGPDVKRARK